MRSVKTDAPVSQFQQCRSSGSCSRYKCLPTRLGEENPWGTCDVFQRSGLRLREGLAASGIALRVLPHQALAHQEGALTGAVRGTSREARAGCASSRAIRGSASGSCG